MAARLAMLAPRLIALVVIWLLAGCQLDARGRRPSGPRGRNDRSGRRRARQARRPGRPRRQGPGLRLRQGHPPGRRLRLAGQGSREGLRRQHGHDAVAGAGRRVVDNGAPVVIVTLRRSTEYAERGVPENVSPYDGTSVVLLKRLARRAGPGRDGPRGPRPPPLRLRPRPQPLRPRRPLRLRPRHPRRPRSRRRSRPRTAIARRTSPCRRPGRAQQRDPAAERAKNLQRRVSGAQVESPARSSWGNWLYQHAWIVTGARFGWADGDVALQTLVQVDRSLYVRFGFGAKSEQVARSTLCLGREPEGLIREEPA